MTLVDLSVLYTVFGGHSPVTRGTVTVLYVVGTKPFTDLVGDEVRFSTPMVLPITGDPLVADLAPTRGRCAAKVVIEDHVSGRTLIRHVEIPDVPTISFGELVDVDPATFQPSQEGQAAWDAAVAAAQSAVAGAVAAKDAAMVSAEAAGEAADAAVIAAGEAVPVASSAVTAATDAALARDDAQQAAGDAVEAAESLSRAVGDVDGLKVLTTSGRLGEAQVVAQIGDVSGELPRADVTIGALDLRADRPIVVAHCSDSTGYRADQFFELGWRALMAELWPERPARVRRWDAGTQSYSDWESWQAGTGAQGVDFYNGGAAGSTPAYHLARLAAMYPVAPDLVVINHMHNFDDDQGGLPNPDPIGVIQQFVDALTALYGKTFGVIVNSQNPRFGVHAWPAYVDHIRDLREYALKKGWAYVPSYEAFVALPDQGRSLLLDDLHPAIGTGRVLQADVFEATIRALSRRQAAREDPIDPPEPVHPLSVGGFASRYVASETPEVVGQPIAAWADLGAAGAPLTQNTAGARPTRATVNDIECVTFDGVDDALYATGFTTTEAEPLTVVLVAKSPWPTATKTVLTADTRNILRGATGNLSIFRSSAVVQVVEADGWHFIAAVFDGASSRNHVDGTSVAGNVGTSTPSGSFRVGTGTTSGGSPLHVAELVVYRGALTVEQIASLRTDMKAEYSALP